MYKPPLTEARQNKGQNRVFSIADITISLLLQPPVAILRAVNGLSLKRSLL
jgi:hypothetical protein